MSERRLRGVIFDMDGVLVNSHAVHRRAWKLFFQTLDRRVSDSEMDFILDGRKRCDILRHFLGDCGEPELEELGRRKDHIFRQMRFDIAAVPGAVRLIGELHLGGVELALATSASRSRARSTLSDLGLLGCFRAIVTGEDVSAGKPDPAVYRLAFTRLAIETECILAVEDAASGIRSAVAAGLSCIGIGSHETSENLRMAGAVHVLPDFQSVTPANLEGILLGGARSETPAAVAATWRATHRTDPIL